MSNLPGLVIRKFITSLCHWPIFIFHSPLQSLTPSPFLNRRFSRFIYVKYCIYLAKKSMLKKLGKFFFRLVPFSKQLNKTVPLNNQYCKLLTCYWYIRYTERTCTMLNCTAWRIFTNWTHPVWQAPRLRNRKPPWKISLCSFSGTSSYYPDF